MDESAEDLLQRPPAAPPAATAPQPHRAPPRANGTRFEAACPHGHAQLFAEPRSDAARHALDAALLLSRCEPLLARLDAWLGGELDWRWVDSTSAAHTPRPNASATAQGATARWRGPGPHGGDALVTWPWALLRSLPPPEPALAAALRWQTVAAVLSVAELRLDGEALQALEPGGAVLLPPSFGPNWQGRLRSAGEADGCGTGAVVDLSVPTRPHLAPHAPPAVHPPQAAPANSAATADPTLVCCEVRMDVPFGAAAERIAGWCPTDANRELADLSATGMRAELWRCASAASAGHSLAQGRLAPWGDGWALLIDAQAQRAGAADKV